jgi:glycine cleavage system H protein
MYPNDRKYSTEHEWAKVEADGTVSIGITDYAQEHLGDIVFLDLPETGTSVKQSEKLGEVESVKSVSDIYSPISGQIVETNQAVMDSPELVNQFPHDDGWLVRIEPSDKEELESLMSDSDYQSFLEGLDS